MSVNRVLTPQTEALFTACEQGDTKTASKLIADRRTNINWHKSEAYGATPLMLAIVGGFKEIAQMLIEAGADLSQLKTPDKNSPLHEAAIHNQPEILRLILKRIASGEIKSRSFSSPDELIDSPNQFGNTPLHNAARSGSEECIQLLLEAGAQVTAKNTNGSIPLHHACYCEIGNVHVVQLLVKAGSDVNDQDMQGNTPMIIAAKRNHAEVIQFLMQQGADLELTNSLGESAQHFATLHNHKEAMEILGYQ